MAACAALPRPRGCVGPSPGSTDLSIHSMFRVHPGPASPTRCMPASLELRPLPRDAPLAPAGALRNETRLPARWRCSIERNTPQAATSCSSSRASDSSPDNSHDREHASAGRSFPSSRRVFVQTVLLSLAAGPPLAGAPLIPHYSDASASSLAESSAKTPGLTLEERKNIIAADIRDRHYFVTGNMTTSLYRDDCFFVDPMNEVVGVDKYILGISLFLDPSCASNELISVSATEPNTVEAKWTLSGYFRYLPWQPYLRPIVGGTKYVFDEEGLIVRHEESWSITPADAWRITLTPAFQGKDSTCQLYREGQPPLPSEM